VGERYAAKNPDYRHRIPVSGYKLLIKISFFLRSSGKLKADITLFIEWLFIHRQG
jgi:hypothetical protein